MRNRAIAFVILAIAGLGVFYAWARVRFETGRVGGADIVIVEGPRKHLVTPAMLEATGKMTKQVAPSFRVEATDGQTYRLEDVTSEMPLVLIFIKDGCPCSAAAQPFFDRLSAAYIDDVRFLGVIDADVSRAKEWAKENRVPFPILADPESRIVHNYKAESSAYVALVSKEGTIEKLWPGYSAQMLNDASERLARLSGSEPRPVDTTDAPAEMTTGCPY
jgi:peroxiredoxin